MFMNLGQAFGPKTAQPEGDFPECMEGNVIKYSRKLIRSKKTYDLTW
jgi:hypothetical protein